MDFIPGVKLTDVVRQRPKPMGETGQQQQQQQPAGLPQGESWWGRTIGAYFSRRSVRACAL
jgi:hypothetical protein